MIVTVDSGAGTVHKRAETSDEADRLRREAQVLDVARHPGVVQLLGAGSDGLTLRLVDGVPLSRLPTPSAGEIAQIAADAATTMADLHDIGVVHGAVTADHLLVDSAGRTVLCSFGRATLGAPEASDTPGRRSAGSPAATDGRLSVIGGAAADVAALATVLAAAAPAGNDVERLLRAVAGAPDGRWPARRLATLLTTPPDRRRRPGHRPQPCPRGADAPPPPALPSAGNAPATAAHRWGRVANGRRSKVGIGLVGAALALVVVTGAAVVSPSLVPTGDRHLAACPAADQGCRPLARPGGVIQTSAGRYRLGRPGDLVVVGRWRCGNALPALLRPATGEVWVWDGWAPSTGPLAARLLARIPKARTLTVAPVSSGCDGLRVLRTEGRPVAIRSLEQP